MAPLLLAAVLGACGGPSTDRVIVIKFPHVTAPASPKGQGAQRFKQLAEARLPGRVRVEVYPSSQLMNDDDSLEALAFGEIQMIATSLSKFDRLTKRFQLFDLPFLFQDLTAVEHFQTTAEGRSLLTVMVDKGILGLAFWHNGMKQFGAPRPLRRPADAAGLKFRIMESDVLQAQIRQIGGSPQKMAFGEVYQALQTGAVDAQENTWSNIYSQKFYEVQPYLMETNHGYLGYLLATNPGFWNALPADVRSVLEEVVTEVTVWVNRQASAINHQARSMIEKSGRSQIITLSDAELQSWRAAMLPVWDKFRDQIGPEIIRIAQVAGQ
ncbi:MAG: DctP family TRAP transporter solute-binding subunit [Gammaproteobacteria bacterium]